ncbi:MAG: hypothetical protein AAB865_00885 [Patescibacteria group bacterium]
MKLNLYIAGKVSKDSVFQTSDWRTSFCDALSNKAGIDFVNLDPTKKESPEPWDAQYVFGSDCLSIQKADLVVAHLTDDISVGGSQEMVIAKYFSKPLFAIAPWGGKFRKVEAEVYGKMHSNFVHPFVGPCCDRIANDIDELADQIKVWFGSVPPRRPSLFLISTRHVGMQKM